MLSKAMRKEAGQLADDFAAECGASFHRVIFQDMAIVNGPCRIIRWHLGHETTGAKYDTFLTTTEYCDGSFSVSIDVDAESWGKRVALVKRMAKLS